jgi:hypothetical protein
MILKSFQNSQPGLKNNHSHTSHISLLIISQLRYTAISTDEIASLYDLKIQLLT